MGLCYSINREFRRITKVNGKITKRTFKGLTKLVRLVDIYDGDTFKVVTCINKNEPYFEYSLRLSGFDTPEIKPLLKEPNRELHKAAGLAVRDRLKDLYSPGYVFLVDFEREDKYGRLLGTVYTTKRGCFGLGPVRKDKNLCQWIIDQKWGLPYGGQKKQEFSKEYLEDIMISTGNRKKLNEIQKAENQVRTTLYPILEEDELTQF